MCDHRNHMKKINHLPQRWCIPQLNMMYRYLKKKGRIKGEHKKNRLWRKKHHGSLHSSLSDDPKTSPRRSDSR